MHHLQAPIHISEVGAASIRQACCLPGEACLRAARNVGGAIVEKHRVADDNAVGEQVRQVEVPLGQVHDDLVEVEVVHVPNRLTERGVLRVTGMQAAPHGHMHEEFGPHAAGGGCMTISGSEITCSMTAVRFLPPWAMPMACRMLWKASMRWLAMWKASCRKLDAAAGLPALLSAICETTVIPACSCYTHD